MQDKHFSEFWDKIHNKELAKNRALTVLKKIKEYNPDSKHVLELGVGTGNVLKYFKDTFVCYGIDIDPKYIEICQQKIPKGNFIVSSMNEFKIDKKFDTIFCIYDTLNFLTELKQWDETFFNVKKHLNKNGIFIFDFYLPLILDEMKDKAGWHEEFDFGMTTCAPVVKNDYLQWIFKISEKNKKQFKEYRYDFFERIFPRKDVLKLINKHFKILENHKISDGLRELFVVK
jgi:SAM-dependent methyltransferase